MAIEKKVSSPKKFLLVCVLIPLVILVVFLLSCYPKNDPPRQASQPVISPTLTKTTFFNPTLDPTPSETATRPLSTQLRSTATPSPVPIKLIQLAWFYKPPINNDLASLKRYFDLFILTRLDEPMRDSLRAQGANGPFLQYLRLDAIHDPGSCQRQPYYNQVADRFGDLCSIRQQHPDWLLRDDQGNSIVEQIDGAKYVMMDPGNPGWRDFWLQRARSMQEQWGWDGVFLDNVAASRAKFTRLNGQPNAYKDDPSYQVAVEGFLQYLSSNYFRPTYRPLYANIIDLGDTSVWFRYLKYLDGAMEEAFAVGWSADNLTIAEWEEQTNQIEKTQALGKQVILVSQGDRYDLPREEFALASYLLINQGRAAFRYTNDRSYDQMWLYANYQIKLGQPLGSRYRNGNSWQRDFSAGKVIVDPTAHTAMISVY